MGFFEVYICAFSALRNVYFVSPVKEGAETPKIKGVFHLCLPLPLLGNHLAAQRSDQGLMMTQQLNRKWK